DIRWPLLANYARLYQVSSASDGNPLTGLRAQLPSGYQRKMITDTTAAPPAIRTEPSMGHIREPILMPTVVRVDTIFSLVARPAHQDRATQQYPYMLHLMYLPVITLHNPYNTQLRCNNFKVEFADIPVGFKIWVNGRAATTSANLVPMNSLYKNENLN